MANPEQYFELHEVHKEKISLEEIVDLTVDGVFSSFTSRQKDVLQQKAFGYSNSEIGEELSIAEKTVEKLESQLVGKVRNEYPNRLSGTNSKFILTRAIIYGVENREIDFPNIVLPINSLSARQREVAMYVAEGYSTPEIAEKLGLSIKTIEVHRSKMSKKLGFSNSYLLAAAFAKMGIKKH